MRECFLREGERRRFAFVSGLTLRKEDVVRIVTGSGGGFGEPKRRDPDLVRRDVEKGLITTERAGDIYGVET